MSGALRRLVHVGCRDLGLGPDDRHALQLAVTGKASLTDMNDVELNKVIDRLKADGFKPFSKGRSKRATASRPDLRLIHVLWTKLGEAGALEKPGRAGLNAFLRSRFGRSWGVVPADVDMLRDANQIDDVIRALKDWGQRAGIDFDWQRASR